MDFTVASTLLLLWGYLGKETLCRKPQRLEKLENALDVNCGPPSDHATSRMAVRQKDCRRAEMTS